MIKKPITMNENANMEARPIALLVNEASQYESQVYIEIENKKINAKSIMGMMSLRLVGGDDFVVVTEGKDEEEAARGIENFFATR